MTPYDELRQLSERWSAIEHPSDDVQLAYCACAFELRAVLDELEHAGLKPLPVLRPITTTLLRVGAEPQPTTPAREPGTTESQ